MNVQPIQVSEHAYLTPYLHTPSAAMPDEVATKRPAVIICPGGGYEFCSDLEADAPAFAFANMGCQVFVLRYSVLEHAGNKQPLTELAKSVKLVREHSADWQIDPEKIVVCGFSAGAHLAASCGLHWNDPELVQRCAAPNAQCLRPDAMILCYPVITAGEFAHRSSIDWVSANCKEPRSYWSMETQVDDQTPPAFLWHTMNDPLVPVENSFLFAQAMHKHGVNCECHIFADGAHGMSTATREVGAQSAHIHSWVALCGQWLEEQFGPLGGF